MTERPHATGDDVGTASPARRPRRRLVVHVITRMILGGAQENTLLSVLGTDAEPDMRSLLVTGPGLGPEGSLLEQLDERRACVRVVPSLRRALHPLHDALALADLVWLLWRLRPAVVHTHSSKAGILGRLAARLAGVPVVVHTIHGLPFHAHQSRWEHALFVASERVAARLADRIYAVADAMCNEALAAGVGRPGQLRTVYSGMAVAEFLAAGADRALATATRRRLGLDDGDQVVVLVGRLFDLKGHDDLLEAASRVAARLPRLRLLFVGDGARRAELEALAARLGLAQRVVFAGLVSPREVPAMLAAADLLVHTSLREGLARVLPQALLAGTPVISYDTGGAGEVVVHERTGVLLESGDVAGLASWMVRLLGDPSLGRRLAAAGRELCRRRFAAEEMVGTLCEDYRRLLRGAGFRG